MFPSVKKSQRANKSIYGCEKVDMSWFCDFFFIFHSAFTAVKRDSRLLTKYVKRVLFINGRYTIGISFLPNMVITEVRGGLIFAQFKSINIYKIYKYISGRDDRRSLGGLIFSNLGFYWVGILGKYFLGGALILAEILLSIKKI